MKNKYLDHHFNPNVREYTFHCGNCNRVGNVIVENWIKGSNGPFKIDFISHDERLIAMCVDEVKIKPKVKGEILQYNFCANCTQIIKPALDNDYVVLVNQKNKVMD